MSFNNILLDAFFYFCYLTSNAIFTPQCWASPNWYYLINQILFCLLVIGLNLCYIITYLCFGQSRRGKHIIKSAFKCGSWCWDVKSAQVSIVTGVIKIRLRELWWVRWTEIEVCISGNTKEVQAFFEERVELLIALSGLLLESLICQKLRTEHFTWLNYWNLTLFNDFAIPPFFRTHFQFLFIFLLLTKFTPFYNHYFSWTNKAIIWSWTF